MIDTADFVSIETPKGHGARFLTRPHTSDAALVSGILGEDEYDLAKLPPLAGWAIDIGAHIGIVTMALALDNPNLQVVAVEAVPDNARLLRQNITFNLLGLRVFVEEAAAGAPGETEVPITYGWTKALNQPDDYMADNRYIGGMVGPNDTSTTISCPALSLDTIMERYGIERVALLKLDCEGCEWFVLRSPMVERCDRIVGELHHGKRGGAPEFRALLEPTHIVTMDDSQNVTLFDAVRR